MERYLIEDSVRNQGTFIQGLGDVGEKDYQAPSKTHTAASTCSTNTSERSFCHRRLMFCPETETVYGHSPLKAFSGQRIPVPSPPPIRRAQRMRSLRTRALEVRSKRAGASPRSKSSSSSSEEVTSQTSFPHSPLALHPASAHSKVQEQSLGRLSPRGELIKRQEEKIPVEEGAQIEPSVMQQSASICGSPRGPDRTVWSKSATKGGAMMSKSASKGRRMLALHETREIDTLKRLLMEEKHRRRKIEKEQKVFITEASAEIARLFETIEAYFLESMEGHCRLLLKEFEGRVKSHRGRLERLITTAYATGQHRERCNPFENRLDMIHFPRFEDSLQSRQGESRQGASQSSPQTSHDLEEFEAEWRGKLPELSPLDLSIETLSAINPTDFPADTIEQAWLADEEDEVIVEECNRQRFPERRSVDPAEAFFLDSVALRALATPIKPQNGPQGTLTPSRRLPLSPCMSHKQSYSDKENRTPVRSRSFSAQGQDLQSPSLHFGDYSPISFSSQPVEPGKHDNRRRQRKRPPEVSSPMLLRPLLEDLALCEAEEPQSNQEESSFLESVLYADGDV